MGADIRLSNLKEGEKAIISSFTSDEIPAKICNLGLTPGAEIFLFRKAPFNGPYCISLGNGRQCKVALRKEEANSILVKTF